MKRIEGTMATGGRATIVNERVTENDRREEDCCARVIDFSANVRLRRGDEGTRGKDADLQARTHLLHLSSSLVGLLSALTTHASPHEHAGNHKYIIYREGSLPEQKPFRLGSGFAYLLGCRRLQNTVFRGRFASP